ncbi:ADP-dependent (S)-NAD(P)H-hydrate dehydratase [Acrasis kona]|uniref:ATP-dependent (S)-NAD(P)H-hydrate dehydratase n=1 Tax=Acrasis kona TaxID=1008807 RepID=A0AAW2ZN02_9EUKA
MTRKQVPVYQSLLTTQYKLPDVEDDSDKEDRGRILIVGGSKEQPGGIILAALAALRVGVGKLRIATCESIASGIAITIPESRVFSLPETKSGHISRDAAQLIAKQGNAVNCVLIGPGMVEEEEGVELVKNLLPLLNTGDKGPAIVLDAVGFAILSKKYENQNILERFNNKVIITPHLGEAASLLGVEKSEIKKNPDKYVEDASKLFGAVVALKGSKTHIVSPNHEELFIRDVGGVGLATSGSGDVLSGAIAGIASGNADLLTATLWGCYLHGKAGLLLEKKVGRVGFIAREIVDQIVVVYNDLCSEK